MLESIRATRMQIAFGKLLEFDFFSHVRGACHPRRPRGLLDIFGRKFTSRAEELRELILNEPVPEEEEFRPADWAEKHFSAQSAMRSSRVTLSPSYTK